MPLSFLDLIGVQSWTGRFRAWGTLGSSSGPEWCSPFSEGWASKPVLPAPSWLNKDWGQQDACDLGGSGGCQVKFKGDDPEILSNVLSLLSLHSKTLCENIPMWEDQKLAIRLSSESTDGQTEDAVRPHHHGGGGPACLFGSPRGAPWPALTPYSIPQPSSSPSP